MTNQKPITVAVNLNEEECLFLRILIDYLLLKSPKITESEKKILRKLKKAALIGEAMRENS